MRVPAWLAVFCAGAGSARALIFTLPATTTTTGPFTITYQSEASDPAGNLTFWIGHLEGVGGYFDLLPDVLPATTPTKLQVDLIDETGDGCVLPFRAVVCCENNPLR
ncbi:hypothetical protein C8R46DRAFT_480632 [Mycena filopes]|nr:hypothetical protein C8R46DRAFT_480632 [Mycena filopes]